MTVDKKTKYSFPGGVHPPEYKELTENCSIEIGKIPPRVIMHLSQHIGAIGESLVQKGDEVEADQVIGKSEAWVSAPVHSPVKGKVCEVSLQSHPVLGRSMAVTIETAEEGNEISFPMLDFQSISPDNYTQRQIIDASRDAGLVGMGGAGFPTPVKLEPNPRLPRKTLIINGCECEPFITCDYRMMVEYTDQLVAGILFARKASGCGRVIIGIEDNKPKAVELVKATLEKFGVDDEIELLVVKTKYPQGGERQLIRSVLRKYVPTGGIPPMMGVVVMNVATAVALVQAVVLNKPLTHRVVTVTGHAIAKPSNLYVPIGTPLQDMLDYCGGVTEKSAKVLLGGPMMGLAVADLQTPITKTSGAITVLTADEIGKSKFKKQQTPCIRCGRCLEVCPENLNPTKIAHAVKKGYFDIAEQYFMGACIECGCCSYVCPAHIEITGLIKTGKIHNARQKKKMPK